jgi:ADP-heptose:LPS heptosyltransferase
LGALISHAQVVVAPSTGPLHIATAIGVRVVTMYPPIRVQSAVRWGPYVADDERASVMVPEVFCGQDFHCIGEECVYFPCMRTIQVSQVLDEIRNQLKSEYLNIREMSENEKTLD